MEHSIERQHIESTNLQYHLVQLEPEQLFLGEIKQGVRPEFCPSLPYLGGLLHIWRAKKISFSSRQLRHMESQENFLQFKAIEKQGCFLHGWKQQYDWVQHSKGGPGQQKMLSLQKLGETGLAEQHRKGNT
jgi:hypothetical protein